MSDTTFHTTLTQQYNKFTERRRSSQIAPDELFSNDTEEHLDIDDVETPNRTRKPLQRLRKSISSFQDLLRTMSFCSENLLFSTFKKGRTQALNLPMNNPSNTTQPAKRREMRAGMRAARKELKRQEEVALNRMKEWSWPDAGSASHEEGSSVSYGSDCPSKYGSDHYYVRFEDEL